MKIAMICSATRAGFLLGKYLVQKLMHRRYSINACRIWISLCSCSPTRHPWPKAFIFSTEGVSKERFCWLITIISLTKRGKSAIVEGKYDMRTMKTEHAGIG